MKLTAYDRPIGHARVSAVTIESHPDDAPDYRFRRSDTHQMTWNQLCRRQGRHYHGWRYRVTSMGMHPLDALLEDSCHA